MKKNIVLCILAVALSFSANALKRNIGSNSVINQGPCAYKVTGWVDVNLWTHQLNHCDITLSGPCGTLHFTANIVNGNGGDGSIGGDDQPGALTTHLFDRATGKEIADQETITTIVNSTTDGTLAYED